MYLPVSYSELFCAKPSRIVPVNALELQAVKYHSALLTKIPGV
jgi:hypothetical protein